MSNTIHIKPCKIKLCIESHSTGLSDHVRNTRRYAHDGLIGHRESDSDLRSTVNPDGGQPTGRGRLCHDLIDPD